jgi:hypothetical protein
MKKNKNRLAILTLIVASFTCCAVYASGIDCHNWLCDIGLCGPEECEIGG